MNRSVLRILATMVACTATPLFATQLIVVLRPGGTSWQILEVEKVSFNQKDKVRVGSLDHLALQSDQYKKLPPVLILQAGVIRRHTEGFLVRRSGGSTWEPIAPDGVSIKGGSSFSSVWSSAVVTVQVDKNAKNSKSLRAEDIVAILPGSDRAGVLANFISDESNFQGIGEKDEQAAFGERMSLLQAIAPTTGEPGVGKLKHILLAEMDAASNRLAGGIAHFSDLQQGLRYVPVSEQAFANDDAQKKARKSLLDKQAWLNQRMVILKAMGAGELWDALIEKYSDFERWDNSFEDLRKLRQVAFQRSTEQHAEAAKQFRAAKQFNLALQELKIASERSPANKTIAGLLEEVKAEAEADRGGVKNRKQEDTGSPEFRRVTAYLVNADNYALNSQFDEAEQQLSQAEGLAKDSPRVMFARAKLFDARKQPLQALEVLDEYMRNVSGEKEITDGESLRSKIRLNLNNDKKRLKASVDKSHAEGNFLEALGTAQEGLALDANDPDFLYFAGLESAIARKNADAEKYLNKYLSLSSVTNSAKREEVYKMLPMVKSELVEPKGSPNWLSGYNSPAGIFYCPISLAPNSRIVDVKASRKQTTTFQWNGERLTSIHTATQQQGEQDFQAYFDYFKGRPAVRRVAAAPFDAKEDPGVPRFTPAGTIGSGKGIYLALANHPLADPIMIARLTGQNVAVLVTGNPYFQPFVWEGIHTFIAEYDDQGRVASAHEIGKDGQSPRTLDFKWDGARLMELTERGGAYKRSMSYVGGKLMAETISFRGKNFKIEYKYTGDRLTSARCDDDPSLDSRNRMVTFR